MTAQAFERMVAFRYLRARRQEGFISVIAIVSFLGISLGVAALIITMSVMNGFTTDLLGRILGFGGHVTITGANGTLGDFDAVAAKAKRIPGITAVRPVVEAQVLVSAGGRATGATVRGLRSEDLAGQGLHLSSAVLADFAEDRLVMGYRLAGSLGVNTGDRLAVSVPVVKPGKLAQPKGRSFEVAGLFAVNLPEFDSGYLFMPLGTAQEFLGMAADTVTGLDVFVADPDRADEHAAALRSALGPAVQVTTWQENNAALFGALRVERIVMFVILSLIILVAAFNIVCSMIMLVKNKGQDIAILRTMGATRGMILRVFMLSGASIGVVGTIAGWSLGVALAANLRGIQGFIERTFGDGLIARSLAFFSTVPALIDPVEVGAVLVCALLLSFLATLYPAWRAARLDPIEALRYE